MDSKQYARIEIFSAVWVNMDMCKVHNEDEEPSYLLLDCHTEVWVVG